MIAGFYISHFIYQDILRQEEKTMYMTTRNGDPRARSRAWVFAFTEKMYRYTSPRQVAFTEKMYRYTSPRQGSLDKQRLSSELDKFYPATYSAF